jgi:hypothetical protein
MYKHIKYFPIINIRGKFDKGGNGAVKKEWQKPAVRELDLALLTQSVIPFNGDSGAGPL